MHVCVFACAYACVQLFIILGHEGWCGRDANGQRSSAVCLVGFQQRHAQRVKKCNSSFREYTPYLASASSTWIHCSLGFSSSIHPPFLASFAFWRMPTLKHKKRIQQLCRGGVERGSVSSEAFSFDPGHGATDAQKHRKGCSLLFPPFLNALLFVHMHFLSFAYQSAFYSLHAFPW